ncbi:hypothetical protein [Alsobacter sp. R-9]
MLCPSRTHTHTITPQAIDLKAQAMADELVRGGCRVYHGLDLSEVAAQQLVEEVVEEATNAGAEVVRRVWNRRLDGVIEVAIEVASDADLVLVKLRLD